MAFRCFFGCNTLGSIVYANLYLECFVSWLPLPHGGFFLVLCCLCLVIGFFASTDTLVSIVVKTSQLVHQSGASACVVHQTRPLGLLDLISYGGSGLGLAVTTRFVV